MGDKKKKLVYHIVARWSGPDSGWVGRELIYTEYRHALGLADGRKPRQKYFPGFQDYLRKLAQEKKIETTDGLWQARINVDKLIKPSWKGWGGKYKSKALVGRSLGAFNADRFAEKAKEVWRANNQGDFSFEESIWHDTLQRAPEQQQPLLKKLFAILKYGQLQYRSDSRYPSFEPWPHSLAAALSHGGRIMVQLPPSDEWDLLDAGIMADDFMMWFLEGGVEWDFRMATHSIHPNLKSKPSSPKRKWLKEKKGSWGPMQHIGINLALGGNNRRSKFAEFWSSNPSAEPNGRHGHMYLGYLHPFRETKTLRPPPNWECYRGFLIGIEGSTPLLRDVVGHYHGPKATSSIMKVAGGIKWTFVNILEKPGEYDCMFVNLARRELLRNVMQRWKNIQPRIVRENTDGYAPPRERIGGLMPEVKDDKDEEYGIAGRKKRSGLLPKPDDSRRAFRPRPAKIANRKPIERMPSQGKFEMIKALSKYKLKRQAVKMFNEVKPDEDGIRNYAQTIREWILQRSPNPEEAARLYEIALKLDRDDWVEIDRETSKK
jgi:hypothetical protein